MHVREVRRSIMLNEPPALRDRFNIWPTTPTSGPQCTFLIVDGVCRACRECAQFRAYRMS
jgi:hypothetical protein